ncbi:hypothetical protein G6011_09347 [Alternaria panax]|uniref:Uncharacterized protein n=1 Tax=Alternaria panax TaxID=48097 RepID=A0AAD4NPV4_9PLEO|nr:hypothetical protein G6011_09347 [Alternaria panax]
MSDPAKPSSAASHKRLKSLRFDITHARNGGNSTSFVNTSNTGIVDTTFGSTTDEEDDDETEQHYLNKMTDDTDRKVETVFGKGVEVWKSFNGTVYADVNDRIKKQRRDEEVWGKKKDKRRRDTKRKGKEERLLEQRFDSLQSSESSGSTSTPTPSTYPDVTISFPSLPLSEEHQASFPSTPTASEWEIFPVRQSQYDDFSGTPLEYTPINHPLSSRETAVRDIPNSIDGPTKPLASRAHRSRDVRSASSIGYQTAVPHPRSPSPYPPSPRLPYAAPPPPTIFFNNTIDGSRRIVSGSFGSFNGEQVDRFDGRGYRLLPGQMGGEAEKKEQDGDGHQDGKPDKFKGRPWLRR